jgi:hypothetical protein
VFDRVPEQVLEHLVQPTRVRTHCQVRLHPQSRPVGHDVPPAGVGRLGDIHRLGFAGALPLGREGHYIVDRRLDRARPALELLLGVVPPDRVPDSVGEEFALFGARLLLEVVGRPRGDGLACDLLRPAAGIEDERQVRMVRPDGSAELDPVPSGHLVVGDDAVDRPVTEHPLARIRTVCGSDVEPVVDAGEK